MNVLSIQNAAIVTSALRHD